MDVDHKFQPYKNLWLNHPNSMVHATMRDVAGMVAPRKKEGRPPAIQI